MKFTTGTEKLDPGDWETRMMENFKNVPKVQDWADDTVEWRFSIADKVVLRKPFTFHLACFCRGFVSYRLPSPAMVKKPMERRMNFSLKQLSI